METTAVRVALRVRPLTANEQAAQCRQCITFAKDDPQILLGTDRPFTFDFVFHPDHRQAHVFETSINPLLDRFLDGNNATVLAYGQTGSGKTYSMGTTVDAMLDADSQGIVQRFASTLFERLEQRRAHTTFQVYVSFLELYNEEIVDLLETKKDREQPAIREDIHGQLYWTGVREIQVHHAGQLLEYVSRGSLGRATGATDMNFCSSRSHAIFSISLKQQTMDTDDDNAPMPRRLVSKFHFVDLAGSERLKRTNAFGDRQKEGISINTGLLALGNVISALGDETRRTVHVPYRDSKLTRLLQDSLGGNSHTLMLACVSTSTADYTETLNTLKYANRARNIQNRVEINVDYSDDEVVYLRHQVTKLRLQLTAVRKQQHDPHGFSEEHGLVKTELDRVRSYAALLARDLAQVQSERDLLRQQVLFCQENHPQDDQNVENTPFTATTSAFSMPVHIHDDDDTQLSTPKLTTPCSSTDTSLLVDYLQQIQDLKFDLAETHHRLVYLQAKQQQDHLFHAPSSSLPPGRASLSNSGRHTVKHRKPAVHQRMAKVHRASTSTKRHHHTSRHPFYSHDENHVVNGLGQEGVDASKPSCPDKNMATSLFTTSFSKGGDMPMSCILPNNNDDKKHQSSPNSFDSIVIDDHEVEALTIPVWTDEPRASNSSTDDDDDEHNRMSLHKRDSLSWTDSDHSLAGTSRTSSSIRMAASDAPSLRPDSSLYRQHGLTVSRRKSRDVLKMLHQTQADWLVKRQLVDQLNRSEDEFTKMRVDYEQQLQCLLDEQEEQVRQQEEIIRQQQLEDEKRQNLQQSQQSQQLPQMEVKRAGSRASSGDSRASSPASPKPRPSMTPSPTRVIQRQYESRIKRLASDNDRLQRQVAESAASMATARQKAEQIVARMRINMDQLRTENKQLQKSMHQEHARLRAQLTNAEHEIQLLRRAPPPPVVK
ncbi:P-loop containing nucleoside triphosphate hydrolase protein [Gongronella butleri]|nr:P-loop containing nucleoside triphosphate hydrolase protein [Gongronella butleri]